MSKCTLMIEGSPAVLAAILANLPAGVAVSAGGIPPMPITSADEDDDNAPVNTAAPATDINGLPWDERIHSTSKGTTTAGAWRKRKGVDDATVAAVEAQLRAMAGVTPPPIVPMVPPMPIPPVPMVPPAPVVAPVMQAPPMVPPAPVMAPPPMPIPEPVVAAPAPDPAAGQLDFAQFMQHLSGQMAKRDGAGQPLVHADYLATITAEISGAFQLPTPLTAITDIATDPRMITYAAQLMQRDQRW